MAVFKRKSRVKEGFTNRYGMDLKDISIMNLFTFEKDNQRTGTKEVVVALKYISFGKEEMLYAESNDEAIIFEKIFEKWEELHKSAPTKEEVKK